MVASSRYYSHLILRTEKHSFGPEAGALGEPPLSQLAVTGLSAGLDEAELGFRQVQIAADLLGGLLLQIEANQHVPIAFGQAVQHAEGDLLALSLDRSEE